jgi:flagellar biosynthesis protein FlhF
MKIKRFFAPDMRTAIRQVSEEQGPDAVILSTRKVDGGIEIVSAMDYDQSLIEGGGNSREDSRRSSQASRYEDAAPAPEADWDETPVQEPIAPRIEWSQEPALQEMRQELNTLRDLMQHQTEQLVGKQFAQREPVRHHILKRLRRYGVSSRVASGIAKGIRNIQNTEQAWRNALYELANQINVTDDDIISKGGIVALVGSTGVGKTTTIAKLAARFCMRHSKEQLALITTDNFRVGAEKQLSIYGQILGVPVHHASNSQELVGLLKGMQDKKLVLIDTAGMSQKDRRLKMLSDSLARLKRIRVYLVAAANTQGRAVQELINHYGRDHLHGCILTKLDETASLGEALSVLMEHKLPLAYLSDGQNVPEDLKPARVSTVVAQLVASGKQEEPVTTKTRHDNLDVLLGHPASGYEALGA